MICNNIPEFISLMPAHFRFLKSIKFTRTVTANGCSRFDADIVLSKITANKIENLNLRCAGVFDINIGDMESVSGLQVEIEDVSANQIEGASFKVLEIEQSAFSFCCEDFFAELV
jgi:hypothetical protein